jgi:hypothetical protein
MSEYISLLHECGFEENSLECVAYHKKHFLKLKPTTSDNPVKFVKNDDDSVSVYL